MVTSRCLDGVMVSKMGWNATKVGVIPTVDEIFLIFIAPNTKSLRNDPVISFIIRCTMIGHSEDHILLCPTDQV